MNGFSFLETIKWVAFRTIVGNYNPADSKVSMVANVAGKFCGILIGAFFVSLIFPVPIGISVSSYYVVEFLATFGVFFYSVIRNGKYTMTKNSDGTFSVSKHH